MKLAKYLLLMVIGTSAFAAEITGTEEQLRCVYNNRSALSLFGMTDPVRVYVKSCPEQFLNPAAADSTHGGVSEPSLEPSLVKEPTRPPISTWPLFQIAELDTIACKLDEWLIANPDASADTMITLDLVVSCQEST